MPTTKAENRYLYLTTPLGDDAFVLLEFSGHEAISQLFSYQLDMIAENGTEVLFEKLLGNKISFGVKGVDTKVEPRHFSGICMQMSQLGSDTEYTRYQMTVAPRSWLLTQIVRSRIFQQMTIPDILKQVLTGLDVDYQIQGSFDPREYCVQYNESDFDFASRLMEEEGIYYFFKFEEDSHKMVLANTPQSHPEIAELPENTLIYEGMEGGGRDEERVSAWEKIQDLRSGKYTLWDHKFELPHKHLEAERPTMDSISVGTVTHKLKVGNNDSLEVYEYPGRYAQRYDGIDKGGGEQPSSLQKIFQDNKRTVEIRMQQVEATTLLIRGESNSRHCVPGHKFKLDRNPKAAGIYVFVSVTHNAKEGSIRSGATVSEDHYGNMFTCIPFALAFRPQQVTRRPFIQGCQTAVVVGPAGEEIFTDKYGRIKVQFHWDRVGKMDANSSCWVRVATSWAGIKWGAIYIPRIGHEVLVDFLEGDPDRPVVTGSVFNADTMPPYDLPDNKTVSTMKSRSSIGGGETGFNEIRFEDKKDSENFFMHAAKDMDTFVENDRKEYIKRDRHLFVDRDKFEKITRDTHLAVNRHYYQEIQQEYHSHVVGTAKTSYDDSLSEIVSGDTNAHYKSNYNVEVGAAMHIKVASSLVIEAGSGITLKVGGNFVTIDSSGVSVKGTMIMLNSGGAALGGAGCSTAAPKSATAALKAITFVGGLASVYAAAGMAEAALAAAGGGGGGGGGSAPSDGPTHDPNAEENKEKKHWVEIVLVDSDGKPVPSEPFRVTVPDGTVAEGTLDEKGYARVDGIDPGTCQVTFPALDKDYWGKA